MESPAAEAAADPAAHNFSQVLFTDIPYSYPPAAPITCSYTFTSGFQPHPRDWVGIFKVGWSTTRDYHTFVWVEPCLDVVGQQSRQAVFKEYYLPKDEIEFYQLCYVDSTGQVRGASTPFCFSNSVVQSLDSSPDDDLLVITTQEQVEQSVREKAELQNMVDLMKAENETLKSTLQKEQQEVTSLKEKNEQKEKEMSELVKERDQIKEEKENLKRTLQQQLQENCSKDEMVSQLTKQLERLQQNDTEQKKRSQSLDGAPRPNEEKYARAVLKINQLKEERDQLKKTTDIQSKEVSKLNAKVREGERELSKTLDKTQLLEVDLQSSEKEKERLAAELQRLQTLTHSVDEVREENQELRRRLSQQEMPRRFPDDDLKVQCQTLVRQLDETKVKLAAEKEESRNAKTRVEFLEGEVQHLNKQMEKVMSVYEQEQQKSNKLELQLSEMYKIMADKEISIEEKEHMVMLERQEKEELTRENQTLRNDLEGLRRVYADFQAAAAEPQYVQPDVTSQVDIPTTTEQPEPGEPENLYETIGSIVEPGEQSLLSLVCRHCRESFPGITPDELEQHEQSHRVCPFCTMICDSMEQSVFEDHVYSHEL